MSHAKAEEDQNWTSCWDAYRGYFFRPNDRPEPKYVGDELQKVWDAMPSCHLRAHCLTDPWANIPYARFQGDRWRCSLCGHEERDEILLSVERTLGRLAERTFFSPELIENTAVYQIGRKKANIPLIDPGFLWGALDLAETVTRVLGHWHWAAQWARILVTDVTSSFQQLANHKALYQEPHNDLRLLWKWYQGLKLAQEPCAWFYARLERYSYIPKVDEWMKKEMASWKECGQPMVNCLPLKTYAMEGIVNWG
mmetsp:Transcript_37936/g.118350  ORF Transcript_37936/g.118350 Transcript_37936/m.118350 type:complete len:253 (+) Transcript_37936:905-1663(+)